MSIQVEVPGTGTIDFPDDMTPESIEAYLRQQMPEPKEQAPAKEFRAPRLPGLKTPGNIDLTNRPIVHNKDGTISTVRSRSFGTDQGEVLLPTIADDGRELSDAEAFDQYRKTGKHLGIFETPETATSYAQQLHEQQARDYAPNRTELIDGGRRVKIAKNRVPENNKDESLYSRFLRNVPQPLLGGVLPKAANFPLSTINGPIGIGMDLLQSLADKQRRIDSMREIKDEVAPDGFWSGVGKSFEGFSVAKETPFIGSAYDMADKLDDYIRAKDISERLDANKPVSRQEVFYLMQQQKNADAMKKMKGAAAWGYGISEIAQGLIPFMAEMAMTGPIFGGVKAGIKKGATKLAGGAIERLTAQAAEKGAAGLAARTALKAGNITAGTLAVLPQSMVGSAPMIAGGTLSDQTKGINFEKNEEGDFVATVMDPEDGFAKSLVKNVGKQWIEYATEYSGKYIGELFKGAGGLASKGYAKLGINLGVEDTVKAAKAAIVNRWIGAKPGRTVKAFKEFLKKAKWDGVFEEVAEERLGDIARYGAGLQDELFPGGWAGMGIETAAFMLPIATISAARGFDTAFDKLWNKGKKTGKPTLEQFLDMGRQNAEGLQAHINALNQQLRTETDPAKQSAIQDELESAQYGLQKQNEVTDFLINKWRSQGAPAKGNKVKQAVAAAAIPAAALYNEDDVTLAANAAIKTGWSSPEALQRTFRWSWDKANQVDRELGNRGVVGEPNKDTNHRQALVKEYAPRPKGETTKFGPESALARTAALAKNDLKLGRSVSAAVVDHLKIPVPSGYQRQGDLYVFNPAASAGTQTKGGENNGLQRQEGQKEISQPQVAAGATAPAAAQAQPPATPWSGMGTTGAAAAAPQGQPGPKNDRDKKMLTALASGAEVGLNLPAAEVDRLGVKLPAGYSKQGEMYVWQEPTPAAQPATANENQTGQNAEESAASAVSSKSSQSAEQEAAGQAQKRATRGESANQEVSQAAKDLATRMQQIVHKNSHAGLETILAALKLDTDLKDLDNDTIKGAYRYLRDTLSQSDPSISMWQQSYTPEDELDIAVSYGRSPATRSYPKYRREAMTNRRKMETEDESEEIGSGPTNAPIRNITKAEEAAFEADFGKKPNKKEATADLAQKNLFRRTVQAGIAGDKPFTFLDVLRLMYQNGISAKSIKGAVIMAQRYAPELINFDLRKLRGENRSLNNDGENALLEIWERAQRIMILELGGIEPDEASLNWAKHRVEAIAKNLNFVLNRLRRPTAEERNDNLFTGVLDSIPRIPAEKVAAVQQATMQFSGYYALMKDLLAAYKSGRTDLGPVIKLLEFSLYIGARIDDTTKLTWGNLKQVNATKGNAQIADFDYTDPGVDWKDKVIAIANAKQVKLRLPKNKYWMAIHTRLAALLKWLIKKDGASVDPTTPDVRLRKEDPILVFRHPADSKQRLYGKKLRDYFRDKLDAFIAEKNAEAGFELYPPKLRHHGVRSVLTSGILEKAGMVMPGRMINHNLEAKKSAVEEKSYGTPDDPVWANKTGRAWMEYAMQEAFNLVSEKEGATGEGFTVEVENPQLYAMPSEGKTEHRKQLDTIENQVQQNTTEIATHTKVLAETNKKVDDLTAISKATLAATEKLAELMNELRKGNSAAPPSALSKPTLDSLVDGTIFNRPMSSEELIEVINDPGFRFASQMNDRTAQILTALLKSQLAEMVPSLKWMVRDKMIENVIDAQYRPGDRLAEFVGWTRAEQPVHEFFHDLFENLSPIDQENIDGWRINELHRAARRTQNPFVRTIIAGLLSNERMEEMDSASLVKWIESKVPKEKREEVYKEIYHLVSATEFFTWMMTPRAIATFEREPVAGSFIGQIRKGLFRFWKALKQILNLTSEADKLWDDLLNGRYEYNHREAMDYAKRTSIVPRFAAAPAGINSPQPPPIPSATPPEVRNYDREDTQIGKSEYLQNDLIKPAEPTMAKIESAASRFDQLRYDETLLRNQRSFLISLHSAFRAAMARGRIPQKEIPEWYQPDFATFAEENWQGMMQVSVKEPGQVRTSEDQPPEINEFMTEWGIPSYNRAWRRVVDPNDPKNDDKFTDIIVRSITLVQEERKASALVMQRERARDTEKEIEWLQVELRMGKITPEKAAPILQARNRELASLRKRIANRQDKNVIARADEIEKYKAERVENEAARETMKFRPIKESFFDVRGKMKSLAVKLGNAAQDLKTSLIGAGPKQKRAAETFLMYLEDFRKRKQEFDKFYDTRKISLDRDIKRVLEEIQKAKDDAFAADMAVDGAEEAMNSLVTATATNLTIEELRALREIRSAIGEFAKAMVRSFPQGGSRDMLYNIIEGVGTPEGGPRWDPTTFGVSQGAYNLIVKALREAPQFENAMLTLLDIEAKNAGELFDETGSLNQLLAEDLITEIKYLYATEDEESKVQGQKIGDQLIAAASQLSASKKRLVRSKIRDLIALQVDRRVIENGRKLFDDVADNPELPTLEKDAEASINGFQRMVLNNADKVTFVAFGTTKEVEINYFTGESVATGSKMKEIAAWFMDAQAYTANWELLLRTPVDPKDPSKGMIDPETATAKQKREAGIDYRVQFKRATYQGLLMAQSLYSHVFLEPTTIQTKNTLRNNPISTWLAKQFFPFRTYLTAARRVLGPAGHDLSAIVTNLDVAVKSIAEVTNRYGLKYARLRSAALAKHPECNNTLEEYKKIFNEVANEGRKHGSPLRENMPDPLNGTIIYKEDIDFLQVQKDMYEAMGAAHTNKSGSGRGIVYTGPHREVMVRDPIGVGDYGIPMHVSGEGRTFAAKLTKAYREAAAAAPNNFTAIPMDADLSANSENPAVRFWNEHFDSVIRGIVLDAGRAYRDMYEDEEFKKALRSLSKKLYMLGDWRSLTVTGIDGVARPVRTLDDLVLELATGKFSGQFHLTDARGALNPSDSTEFVRQKLLRQLAQFNTNATKMFSDPAAESKSAGARGGADMESEFTSPAAHFRLPSNWYDFGAVRDFDVGEMGVRAINEVLKESIDGFHRATKSIEKQIVGMSDMAIKPKGYLSAVRELRWVHQALSLCVNELEATFDPKNPSQARQQSTLMSFFINSILSSPTVGIRNVTSGQGKSLINLYALERCSGALSILHAFRNMLHSATNVAVMVGLNQKYGYSQRVRKMMSNSNLSLIRWISDKFVESYFDNVDEINRAGMSLRQPYMEKMHTIGEANNQYQNKVDRDLQQRLWARVFRALRTGLKAGAASYQQVGVEVTDKAINAANNTWVYVMESDWARVARSAYGATRNLEIKYAEAAVDLYTSPKGAVDYEAAIAAASLDKTRISQRVVDFIKLMQKHGLKEVPIDPSDDFWAIRPEELSDIRTDFGRKRYLGHVLRITREAGISLPVVMWRYYKAYEVAKSKGDVPPPMFTEEERRRLVHHWALRNNVGSLINRSTKARFDATIRNIWLLQGWNFDWIVQFFDVFSGSYNMTGLQRWLMAGLGMWILMAGFALIGMFTTVVTEGYRRIFLRQQQRVATVLDRQFWGETEDGVYRIKPGIIGSNLIDQLVSVIPYFGDLVLQAKGVLLNNRGYSPSGRVLLISVANSIANAIAGTATLAWSDTRHAYIPARDFAIQSLGGAREATAWLAPKLSSKRGYTSVTGAARVAADELGLVPKRPWDNKTGGINYNATYGMREAIIIDFMTGNTEKLQSDFQRLSDYYASKKIKDPRTSAKRDYGELHPIMRSFGGKKPTDSEWNRVYQRLTDGQQAAMDKAIKLWTQGANQLGISYDPFKETQSNSVFGPNAFNRLRIGSAIRPLPTPRLPRGPFAPNRQNRVRISGLR